MMQQVVMGMPSNQLPLYNSSSYVPSTNDNDPVSQIFDQFCAADTFQGILDLFQQLCDATGLYRKDRVIFYQLLKSQLMSWKAESLWAKLDKRAMCCEYKKGLACKNTRVLIIGAGPCGLRVAIEMALLGAKAVVVEKRDSFSRNNVLHLWPFLIYDLKALGAKKFFGKFCAGSIDHISIRTLQCILLKVALLLGVEVHTGVSFDGFVEPCTEETLDGNGWHAKVSPADHPVSEFIFDVCFSADGRRNTMPEFKRKELRGKFAIGLTANFINRKTQAEASVEEISGLAYIFNQKFFKDLHENTGVDLENIVYYKDETHYFVMTAKKQSLLLKGVLQQDYDDPELLLSKSNVNMDALLRYAREAADFSTNHSLPSFDFAPNHLDEPDVDMFDFTSMFSAEHACRVVERLGHKLLIGLVGDTLLEPFWPTGSGCARGFLGALDGAWMVRNWSSGEMSPLEVVAERESVYQLLSQTKPENLNKNYENYTIDPNTRYPNLQMQFYKPYQVQSLYDGNGRCNDVIQQFKQDNSVFDSLCRRQSLLHWFQKKLEPYENVVRVVDLCGSWRSGLALCSLIHRHRPQLIDVFALDPNQVASNNQLVFDIIEKHCHILPVATGHQMAECDVPDERMMISYLSAVRDFFSRENAHSTKAKTVEKTSSFNDRTVRTGFTQTHKKRNAGNRSLRGYDPIIDALREPSSLKHSESLPMRRSKVTLLARDLASKFKGELEDKKQIAKMSIVPSTDVCSFCKERVFIVERCIAEGLLFHRQCFRCEICSTLLNITSYSFQMNGEGKEIFCHAKCHEAQPKTSEKRIKLFNQPNASRVILPVDRITFNATRNILLKQSKANHNEMRKKERQDRMNQRNFSGFKTYDDLNSSTEEELCFSSDSDSEKPDLSWDECVRQNEAFVSPSLSEKVVSSPANSCEEEWRMEGMEDGGGSDADWETESEMDLPLQDSKDHNGNAKKIEKEVNSETHEATTIPEVLPNETSTPIVVNESKRQNRNAFFDAVAQPVRIDARLFLGLGQPSLEGGTSTENKASPVEDNKAVETKDDSQGTPKEDKQELNDDIGVNEGLGQEMTLEKRRKQKKRKKQMKVRRKKVMKTKKPSDKRKAEVGGAPCTTAVARTTVAASHQTVAVVPLSEEETSSDEEETIQEKDAAAPLLNPDHSGRSGITEVFTYGATNSVLSASSSSEQDEKTAGSSVEKADSGRYSPVDSESKKEDLSDNVVYASEREGKAPRPGLLSAEAMFSSYEEAVVATSSDHEFSESTGEDEDNVERQLAEEEDVFLAKNDVNVDTMEADDDGVIMLERCNAEQNQKNRSVEADSVVEMMSDENLQASSEDSSNHCQSDSRYRMSVHVECGDLSQPVNFDDVGQNDVGQNEVGTLMAFQCIDADQTMERGSGFESSYSVGNYVDDNSTKDKENLLPLAESGVEYDDEEIGTIAEDFPGLGTLRKDLLKKKAAVKAEVESFSEDDKEMCSDMNRKQFAKEHAANNSTQVKGHESELRHSEDTKEADSYSAASGIDMKNDFEFIDEQRGVASVDPLSRLNCLLRSLSSTKDNAADKLLSDMLLPNEQPVVTAYVDESNICSEQQVTTLFEQESVEAVPCGVGTNEEKVEQTEAGILNNMTLEKPAKTAGFEDRCKNVDENVNYVSPVTVNEATQKDKSPLDSSLPTSIISLNLNETDVLGIDEKEHTSSAIETVMTISEIKESESLVTQKEKVLNTAVAVSQVSEKATEDLSETSAANSIQSFASDMPLTSVAVKEQDHNAGSNTVSSTNTQGSIAPCSIMDAKRRFFREISQPVRISPHTIFKNDFPSNECSSPNQLLAGATITTTLNSASPSSDAWRSGGPPLLITHPKQKEEQTDDDVLASREEKTKRRLLPAIPTDQVPLDVTMETFTAVVRTSAAQVESPSIMRPADELNVLSLAEEEEENHQRMEQNNRRLLPSSHAFSHVSGFGSIDLSAAKGNTLMLERRHDGGSASNERISLLSGNQGNDPSGSCPVSSGNNESDAVKDGVTGLTVRDEKSYSGMTTTNALTAMAENLKSNDCRLSASLGTEINNLRVTDERNSLRENVTRKKMTNHNLTKHQKLLNNSLPELSKKRIHQDNHIDFKNPSEMKEH